MKAEHRKELQTNALADRMGRLLQSFKSRPRRTSLLIWLLVIGVIVGGFAWWTAGNTRKRLDSDRWKILDVSGDAYKLEILINTDELKFKDSQQARLARFQYAWLLTWQFGVEHLLADPFKAFENLKKGQ